MGTISIDPIGIEAGDPNFYRYVGNSPTNATDPSGLRPPPGSHGVVSLLLDDEGYVRDPHPDDLALTVVVHAGLFVIDDNTTNPNEMALIADYGPGTPLAPGKATLDLMEEHGGWVDENEEKRRRRLSKNSRVIAIPALGVDDAKAQLADRLGPHDEVGRLYLSAHGNPDLQTVAPKFSVLLGNYGNPKRGGAAGDAGLKVGVNANGEVYLQNKDLFDGITFGPNAEIIIGGCDCAVSELPQLIANYTRVVVRGWDHKTLVGLDGLTIGRTIDDSDPFNPKPMPNTSREPNVTVRPRP